MWTFYEFVDDQGRPVIHHWLTTDVPASEREDVQAELDVRLSILRGRDVAQWRYPLSTALTGPEWRGIYEIRWKVNRIQYRITYCFGPASGEVVLLAGYLKTNKLPQSAPQLAQNRKARIDEPGRITPYFG